MTRDQAIEMFSDSIAPRVSAGRENTVVSSAQLAHWLIEEVGDERASLFVKALDGRCDCPNEWCINKVIDAVTKCMTELQSRGTKAQNAPTTGTLQ